MITSKDLSKVRGLRISREGGLVFIPALAKARCVLLADLDPCKRTEICKAVQQAVALADSPGSRNAADQRYFHIEFFFDDSDNDVEPDDVDIPESLMPETLRLAWQSAG